MNKQKDEIREMINNELIEANEKFPLFNSPHEGYAVLLEEVEELNEDLMKIQKTMNKLWKCVRLNDSEVYKYHLSEIKTDIIQLIVEGVQVGTMAQKAIISEDEKANKLSEQI